MRKKKSYRRYRCRGCDKEVTICSDCDHGQVYCADGCARAARCASLQRAGARYQRTRRGARKHAARQAAWRERRGQARCKKVTHHGCSTASAVFTVAAAVEVTAKRPSDADVFVDACASSALRCDFCGRGGRPAASGGVAGDGTGAASTGTALRATAQASSAGRACAAGFSGRDRPADTGGSRQGCRALRAHRRLQAGTRAQAPGARSGECHSLGA